MKFSNSHLNKHYDDPHWHLYSDDDISRYMDEYAMSIFDETFPTWLNEEEFTEHVNTMDDVEDKTDAMLEGEALQSLFNRYLVYVDAAIPTKKQEPVQDNSGPQNLNDILNLMRLEMTVIDTLVDNTDDQEKIKRFNYAKNVIKRYYGHLNSITDVYNRTDGYSIPATNNVHIAQPYKDPTGTPPIEYPGLTS